MDVQYALVDPRKLKGYTKHRKKQAYYLKSLTERGASRKILLSSRGMALDNQTQLIFLKTNQKIKDVGFSD